MADHPFQPGALVAVECYQHGFRGDNVLKVHKNGRFTLKSAPTQQWRPHEPGSGWSYKEHWSATATGGETYNGPKLVIWTDETWPLIQARVAEFDRVNRWRKISNTLHAHSMPKRLTEEALVLLEAGVALLKPETK